MDTNKTNEMDFNDNPIINLFKMFRNMYKQYLPENLENQCNKETPLKKESNNSTFQNIVDFETFNDIKMRVAKFITSDYNTGENTVEIEIEKDGYEDDNYTPEQVKTAITEILDKYVFDARTRKPSPTKYKVTIDFYDMIENLDMCEIKLIYNYDHDRFEGNIYIELNPDCCAAHNLDEEYELDVYYNELDKCLHTTNEESRKILLKLTGNDVEVSEDKDVCDDIHECKESYNDLEEPNDVCVNCKGFKECWLGNETANETENEVELVEVPAPEKTYAQALFDELRLDKEDPMAKIYYSAFLSGIFYLLDNKQFDKINYNDCLPESIVLSTKMIVEEARNYHDVSADDLQYHIDLNKLINEIKSNYGFTNVTLCFDAEGKLEKMQFKLV